MNKQIHMEVRIIMEKLLLKIPEVCAITQLGRSTVYGLLDRPDGFITVRIGRAVRIPADSVRQWVERLKSISNEDCHKEG